MISESSLLKDTIGGSGNGEEHSEILRLPPELEREIFETSVHLNNQCAYQLLFVAKRVHEWIEPFIYRVLFKFKHISPEQSSFNVYPLLKEYEAGQEVPPRLRKVCSYATHVLLQGIDVDDAAEVLKLCINARDVALWLLHGSYDRLVDVIRPLPIQRLSIDLSRLFLHESEIFQFDSTIFDHITHLDLIAVTEDFWKDECHNLLLLPSLTHLAVEGSETREVLEQILSKSTTLELAIAFSHYGYTKEGGIPDYAKDSRLVHFFSPDAPIVHWINGALTGIDFWTTGEAMKQRGGLARLSIDSDEEINGEEDDE